MFKPEEYQQFATFREHVQNPFDFASALQEPESEERRWVKAEFRERCKRIFNPPLDYEELVAMLRKRFKDLDDQVDSGNEAIRISYFDNEGDAIEVEDSKDLLDSLLYQQRFMGKKILKFLVETYEKQPVRQSFVQSLPVPADVEVHYIGDSKSDKSVEDLTQQNSLLMESIQNEPGDLNSSFEDHLISSDKNELLGGNPDENVEINSVLAEPSGVNSREQPVDDDNDVFYSSEVVHLDALKEGAKHFMDLPFKPAEALQAEDHIHCSSVRDKLYNEELELSQEIDPKDLEPENSSLVADNEPVNQIQDDPVVAGEVQDEPQGDPVHEQVNAENDDNDADEEIKEAVLFDDPRVELIVNSGFFEMKKDQKFERQVSRKSNIFQKLQGMIFESSKEERENMAVCINSAEQFQQTAPKGFVQFRWALQNQSPCKWPSPVVVRSIINESTVVKPFKLNYRLGADDCAELLMTIYMPQELETDKVVLLFHLEDTEGHKIGESLIGITSIVEPVEPEVAEISDRSSLSDEDNSVKQSSMQYIDDQFYYAKASELVDDGYGSFNRCLQVLKACKGSEAEALRILSLMIFKDFN